MSNNGESPSMDALLAQAQDEPRRRSRVSASEYVPVIEVLRNKGLKWQEIADWLNDATGDSFTFGTIQAAAHYAKKKAEEAKTA